MSPDQRKGIHTNGPFALCTHCCVCGRLDSDLRVCNAGMPMTPSELGQANFGPTIPRASTSLVAAPVRKRSLSLDMDLVHDPASSKLGITSATLKPDELMEILNQPTPDSHS